MPKPDICRTRSTRPGRLHHARIAAAAGVLLLLGVAAAASPLLSRAGAVQQVASATRTTLPPAARVSERLFGLAGLSNVGRVAPAVFRGAQPAPEGYRTLKAMGIRTVVNLRALHSEKQAVELAGMRSIEIPISTTSRMDPKVVGRVVQALRDPANHPVFVHCAKGQDRTGVVVAVYRMEVDGWNTADAEAEMQSFGFNDAWIQMMRFVRQYRPRGGKGTNP